MWLITIEPEADEDLLNYFRLYRDYFLDTFSDTGLWNEEEICAGYEILAFDLISQIRKGIESKLGGEQVFGWKQAQKGKTILFVASKRFVRITYVEDNFSKVRSVTSMEIWRKK